MNDPSRTTTGYVSYDVEATCPHCKKHLQLNQYPYDDDDETEYYAAGEVLGIALFGGVKKPAQWEGLDIEYQCCGCHGVFCLSNLEI